MQGRPGLLRARHRARRREHVLRGSRGVQVTSATPSAIPPDTLLGGKIRLVRRIGRGGMGDVWVARNESTRAELAVKTLARVERTAAADERFRREARLAATISHRNVVRVFDLVDEADGTLGLVMELLRGSSLEDVMRERGRLSMREAVAVALPILSALHHVHELGVVHRDVKPANVFFAVEPDGHVIPKLLDFGIAKLPAATTALTVDGSVLGTPHYMAPEQIRARNDLDGRSDQFSLAVVLYEMLTGASPFAKETASASLAAVIEHDVDPDPAIDPRLWYVLWRALSKRPYERYATCADLAEALRGAVGATDEELTLALHGIRPRVPPPSSPSIESTSMALTNAHRRPPAPRSRLGLGLAAAGFAAVMATGLLVYLTRPAPTTALPPPPASTLAPVTTVTARVASAPPEASATAEATAAPRPSASARRPAPSASAAASASAAPSASAKPRGRSSVATTPGF